MFWVSHLRLGYVSTEDLKGLGGEGFEGLIILDLVKLHSFFYLSLPRQLLVIKGNG